MASDSDKTPNEKKDWLETTFPVTYTLDDFLHELQEAKKKDESVFAKISSRYSPLDIGSIRNIYEKVWLMNRLQENAKINNSDILEKSTENIRRKCKEVQTEITRECEPLWSSDELDILRSEYKSIKEENNMLKIAVEDYKLEQSSFKEKLCLQKDCLAANQIELSEAKKANTRLYILCKFLKTQLEESEKTAAAAREKELDLFHEKQAAVEYSRELNIELNKLRIDCENLKVDISRQRMEVQHKMQLESERIKSMYVEEIKNLNEKMADISNLLAREKEEHRRAKKGLEHLRKHFASLSSAGSPTPGSPSKGHLTKWST